MQQYGNHKRGSSKVHPHNVCHICDEKNKVSKKRARQEAKKQIAEVCTDIGCSGLNNECPGNVHCEIIQKIFIKEKR